MVSPKKLVQMAKNWQRVAAVGRRRLTFNRKLSYRDNGQSTSPQTEEGHFVVYTIDGKRFTIPLDYLRSTIVMHLFKLSEEGFGYKANVPITLPCEAALLEYAMDFIKSGVSEEVERALLGSVLLPCHDAFSLTSNICITRQQVELCCF